MCNILPEVPNCCFICSYRIGMMFISVCAIMTGSITLSIVEKTSDVSFDKMMNASEIREAQEAYSALSRLIPLGLSSMSVLFMIMGVILLLATLTDSEGVTQIFVVGTFLAVIIGFIMVLAISWECMANDVCILSGLDWLSGSALLVLMVFYLFVWIYFIAVASSYIMIGNA